MAKNIGDFAGASGYNLFWTDLKCVEVQVFRDPTAQERAAREKNNLFEGEKVHKEFRTFCLE